VARSGEVVEHRGRSVMYVDIHVLLAPRGELLPGAFGLKTRRKRVGLVALRFLLARTGPGGCPVTEDVADRLVRLPLFAGMDAGDVDRVVDAVMSYRVG